MLSFAEKVKLSSHDSVDILTARRADGELVYVYAVLSKDDIARFQRDIDAGNVRSLTGYGRVIYEGVGRPGPEIVEYMERYYQFDHAPFWERLERGEI